MQTLLDISKVDRRNFTDRILQPNIKRSTAQSRTMDFLAKRHAETRPQGTMGWEITVRLSYFSWFSYSSGNNYGVERRNSRGKREELSSGEGDNTSLFKRNKKTAQGLKSERMTRPKNLSLGRSLYLRCQVPSLLEQLNTISTHPQPTESLVRLQRGRHP